MFYEEMKRAWQLVVKEGVGLLGLMVLLALLVVLVAGVVKIAPNLGKGIWTLISKVDEEIKSRLANIQQSTGLKEGEEE